MISSFVKEKRKKADQMLRAEEQVPDWIMQGMEAVRRAPSALNAQPVEFQWKDGKLTAHVTIKNGFEEIDMGDRKASF